MKQDEIPARQRMLHVLFGSHFRGSPSCYPVGPAKRAVQQRDVSVEGRKGVPMSDCLHCDIHEMLDVHLQNEQADLGEIPAKVTEVPADLILLAPPEEQAMLLAAVVSNLGGMVLEKSQEADPNSPAGQATKGWRTNRFLFSDDILALRNFPADHDGDCDVRCSRHDGF
jgi:hypothetical protein